MGVETCKSNGVFYFGFSHSPCVVELAGELMAYLGKFLLFDIIWWRQYHNVLIGAGYSMHGHDIVGYT